MMHQYRITTLLPTLPQYQCLFASLVHPVMHQPLPAYRHFATSLVYPTRATPTFLYTSSTRHDASVTSCLL
jgi:hypothetical protein